MFKKMIIPAVAALAIGGLMTVSISAESNPADDSSTYSYTTGKNSYQTRMQQPHEWFADEEEEIDTSYSFYGGSLNAQNRNKAFEFMPTGEDLSDEELDAFFGNSGSGSGAAYENGQYNETAKGSYGYAKGQTAFEQRHASFAGND